MPTYEYACKNCGHRFDVVRSMQDEPLTVCPNCGEPQLRKVFAAPAIAFKGSGFYATDQRKKAKPRDEGDSRKADDASGATAKDDPKSGPKSGDSGRRDSSAADSSPGDSSSESSSNTPSKDDPS
jgi:putative FmdB family regulatory protein